MSPLFDIRGKEDVPDDSTPEQVVHRFSLNTEKLLIKNRENLTEALGKIKAGQHYMFVTGGKWSAHDLLFYLLGQTGPAKVYLCTWAISELAARLLLQAVTDKLITELNCIFDRRLPVRKDKTLQLAKNICTRITLVDCHAKVFVIENESWSISVLGSANLSNNKRIEAGCIFTDKGTMEFNRNWIMDQLLGGDPFNWNKPE